MTDLHAVACTLTGTLAGIAIGAALAPAAAHRRAVQHAWTGHNRRHH